MKICAVICEYNPFHNGHAYQLEQIRKLSGCDKILCLMSGNFTQRGEAAVWNKFTRARQAILNGADVVLELPTVFAVSPAELFAGGAVHILSSIPAVQTLAFGCESGGKADFLKAAQATLSEDKQFKEKLKEAMKDGTSYVKARTQTALAINQDVDEALLTSPNNILGTEYCRAILSQKSNIEPLPIPRKGAGYGDEEIYLNFSSATALRACMAEESRKNKKLLKRNLPKSVFERTQDFTPLPYEQVALAALVTSSPEKIAQTTDCAEGLENRLKAMAKSNPEYSAALEKVVSKRYTLARVKRILAQNLLGLKRKDTKEFLTAPLYCKTLAVRKEGAEELLTELKKGAFPLLVRKSDAVTLKKEALACFELDARATELYNVLSKEHTNEFETLFI